MSQATLIRSSEKINRNVENMALSDFNTGGGDCTQAGKVQTAYKYWMYKYVT